MRATVLLATLALSFAASSWAYQPLITDDTGTQGADGNQLEIAWGHDHAKVGGASTHTHSVPLVYTRGLSDTLDIALSLPWQRSNASGLYKSDITNPSLAMKWRFYEQADHWSLALKPEVVFPVSAAKSANGLGDYGTAYKATLIASHPTSFGEFHVNAGVSHFDDKVEGGVNTNSWHLSTAPAWRLNDATLLALDLGLDHESIHHGGSDTSHYALLGLVYSPNQNLDLSLGVQKTFSVSGSSNILTGTIGATWRFK